jgi:hypothetical protein
MAGIGSHLLGEEVQVPPFRLGRKDKTKDKDKTRYRDLKMKQGSVTGLVDLSQSHFQVFESHPRSKNALIGLVPE